MTLSRFSLLLPLLAAAVAFAEPGAEAPAAKFPTGKETAARFTVPPGFFAKCFASEPDVRKPIAIDFDSKGRVWVLECFTYPRKAPAGQGKDRIRVFEDTDGDGVADKVTTFAEGLNLATGMAVGHGGVFVGAAPELLFLQDTDGDGKADRTTVLLDGWGFQDTHETLNSFIWGPDGWLYGCHGVFTHSNVGVPGCKPEDRVKLNAGIWRYHPKTHSFELFAEGGSNQWGYDYDEHGEGFFACCVIPHLFHVIPGGRYARQAGQNFNPHNYGEIKWICEDLHYYGGNPHQANKDPRSLKFGGGHAHAGCLVYQGGAYPPEWTGKILMNNIHGGRINADQVTPKGATYVGNYHGDLLVSNDPNFRVVQLRTGPDGSVYMIDWCDPLICHNTDPKVWNRNYGRIYKLEYHGEQKQARAPASDAASARRGPAKRQPPSDMAKLTSKELVDCLFDDNSWVWRQALLLLGERGDGSAAPALKEIIGQSVNEVDALRALWALHACGAANETVLKSLFGHKYPWVRAWAIRLYGQLQHVESWLDEPLKAAVEKEQDIHVLREMASMLQRRLPAEFRTNAAARDWRASLLAALSEKAADKNDPVLLFMTWLAWEPLVGEGSRSGTADPQARLVDLKTKAETAARLAEPIYRRCFRKLASNPDPNAVLGLMKALAAIDDGNIRLQGLEGMLEALRGRRLAVSGAKLMEHGAVLKEHLADPELMRRYQLVALHFGDEGAVAAMEAEAADGRLELARRIEAVQALALARLPQSAAPLLKLAIAGDLRLQAEALRALGSFESPEIPAALTKALPTMPAALRKEAILLLATKRAWAGALLDALKAKAITREELTENDVRRILAFNDKELTERVEAVWGKLRTQTPENIKQMMAKYTDQLRDLPADRAAGKAVFAKTCQTCHKLFGEGHSVGPELTGANRRDPNYLLENILDPNKLVGKEYYAVVVEDKRGVLHTGLLAEDAPDHVTLKAENDKLTTIARKDIEQIKVSDKSLMPEGLPNNVTEKEFRDLIAYLIEDAYLTQGKIAGPFKMALDYAGPIETAADPLKTPGVSWKPFAVGPFGLIDMEKQKVLAPPTDSTAYVLFEVKAPTARKTTLETAADEDLKVWVNGREVFSRPRTFQPVRIEVELKEGVNRLMFKVHNIYGPSWLWARLADPKRELETAPGN